MDVMMNAKPDISYRSVKSKVTEVKMNHQQENGVKKNSQINEKKDIYENVAPEQKATYDKPNVKVDQKTIQQLRDESEKVHAQLKQIVVELLKRQGLKFQDIKDIEPDVLREVTGDEIAQKEARAMLEEDGELGAAKVSDRIVDFAKAISGGDKTKLALLKAAIDDGFEAARINFGDELPDISKETYRFIMDKLDAWAKEDEAMENAPTEEMSGPSA